LTINLHKYKYYRCVQVVMHNKRNDIYEERNIYVAKRIKIYLRNISPSFFYYGPKIFKMCHLWYDMIFNFHV